MKTRHMEKTNIDCSLLGFGLMRLPLEKEKSHKDIDEKEAIKMIRHAIDSGINYLDTAYVYHGKNSEKVLAKALKDGYREKAVIATKLPMGPIESHQDMEKLLDEQLERLGVECIDYYLLHSMNKEGWKKAKKYDGLKFLDNAKKQGKIKYAAFSFHDSYDLFEEIIDAYDWDMCQIQLNYMDENWQAGVRGLKYAGKKGIDVVIMEPLRGGDLIKNLPQSLAEHFEQAPVKRTPLEWAFRWLTQFPEVKVILSGMSTMEQLEENIELFKTIEDTRLSLMENQIMEKATKIINEMTKVKCTGCAYCMPCPHGVNIPHLFDVYNNYHRFDKKQSIKKSYQKWKDMGEDRFTADLCVECGACEPECPQGIEIIQTLKELDEELSE